MLLGVRTANKLSEIAIKLFVNLNPTTISMSKSDASIDINSTSSVSKTTASIPMGVSTPPVPKMSQMAVASMYCGVIGIVLFGIILGPLAIIFGRIAIKRIDENPEEWEGRDKAKTGIICGAVAIVLEIVLIYYIVSNL